MNIQRSPGPLSTLGLCGLVIFGYATLFSFYHQNPLAAALASGLAICCWMWGRQAEGQKRSKWPAALILLLLLVMARSRWDNQRKPIQSSSLRLSQLCGEYPPSPSL